MTINYSNGLFYIGDLVPYKPVGGFLFKEVIT